jgi:putative endonuclease
VHYVYLLRGINNEHIYVGNTADIEKRLEEHNNGSNYSTRKYAPFKLVYYEAYLEKADALERERKLKHHGSVIGHLKRRLKNSLS